MLDVCLLGTGGMMPLPNRWLTALLTRYNGKMALIDCGEGTQITLKMMGWGFKSIDTICFTHYHGDHIAGLPGILLTIGNSGRAEPLTLIGPTGLRRVVEGIRVIAPELPYPINFIEVSCKDIEENKVGEFVFQSCPVEHTIPCVAYNINIQRNPRFDPIKAEEEGIPKIFWSRLQKGETIDWEERILTPDMVLGELRKGLKVSYCTDSRPVDTIPDFIHGADLFICEGMYGEEEKLSKAKDHRHMLFSEAAMLAKKGNVKELWLTHFSPALTYPEEHILNAKNIFYNTVLGQDRLEKSLYFDNTNNL